MAVLVYSPATWSAVWLSGDALVRINKVTLHWAQLVLGMDG